MHVMKSQADLHQAGGGERKNCRAQKIIQLMDISILNKLIIAQSRKQGYGFFRGDMARNLESQQMPFFRDQSQGRKKPEGKSFHMSRYDQSAQYDNPFTNFVDGETRGC